MRLEFLDNVHHIPIKIRSIIFNKPNNADLSSMDHVLKRYKFDLDRCFLLSDLLVVKEK